MADGCKIEWTDATWNPVTGCSAISEGCANCYAKRMAKRLAGRCGYPMHGGFAVTAHPERLDQPLRWRKPRRVFVCSMGDLFHEDVPDDFIDRVWAAMVLQPQHVFQVLTKRPLRMHRYLADPRRYQRVLDAAGKFRHERPALGCVGISNPSLGFPGWIHLGVTAENQRRAEERIPLLLQTPAAVRFVSLEPMLGPVDLDAFFYAGRGVLKDSPSGQRRREWAQTLNWVICGAETGPGARPMWLRWARDLRDQCRTAGVPFFMKKISGGLQPPPDLMIRDWPNA